MNVRAALLSPLLLLSLLSFARAAEDEPGLEIRAFPIQHMRAVEANAIVRSLMNPRATAIDEARNTVIIHDERARLDQAAGILQTIDVPEPRWTGRLVAETAGGRTEDVRVLQLAGPTSWMSGGEFPADHVKVDLVILEARTRLVLDVGVSAAAGGDMGRQHLRRRETQRAILSEGESIELLRADGPASQSGLASLLGTSGPVEALRLVVSRDGAPPRQRRPSR